jgi:hypothetical protein
MIESSQICFILCENKDFLTKQNDQTVPPHIQNLQTKQTENFPLFPTNFFCPLHPTLLRDLEFKLAVLVIRKFRVRVSSQIFEALSQNCKSDKLVSQCLFIRQSRWNNSVPSRRIFMKFDI